MFTFIPKDTFFIERTDKPFEKFVIDENGEPTGTDGVPTLKDFTFKVEDNFYVHCQDTIYYYTVGEEELITVQIYKGVYPNHGLHRNDGSVG